MRVQCLIKSEGDNIVVRTKSTTIGIKLIKNGIPVDRIERTVGSVLELPLRLSATEDWFVYMAGCEKLIDLAWISKTFREENNMTLEELCEILNK